MAYAKEYTPELTKEMLAGELGDIDQLVREQEGVATSNAYARGLGGQAMHGSLIGAVRAGGVRQKAATIADFNAKLAGLRREERLTEEGRAYETEQTQKDREFQEKMTRLQSWLTGGQEANMMRARNVAGQQGAVTGMATQIGAGLLVGGILGACDRALKKNIRRVGAVGPIGLYEFEYRAEEHPSMNLPRGRRIGPMAQDVEKFFPAAVVVRDGFKAILTAEVL